MSNENIALALAQHNMRFRLRDNRVYALESWVLASGAVKRNWIDLTGYSFRQLREWLGY